MDATQGFTVATKTDGTLWAMGENNKGQLGQNSPAPSDRSSPVQIPGTTWSSVSVSDEFMAALKTDGTLWSWGYGNQGRLAQNNKTNYSSPVQVPGTNYITVGAAPDDRASFALREES